MRLIGECTQAVLGLVGGWPAFRRARFALCSGLVSALALGACATTPAAPAVSAEEQEAAAAREAERILDQRAMALADFLSTSGEAAPALLDVERVMGSPDIMRREGEGMALTYRLDTCALLLVLRSEADAPAQLSGVYPGPRRGGAAEPTLQTCAREAIVRGAPGVQ